MTAVSFTILGEPASKANSRKIVRIRGRTASIKSDKARSYAATAMLQIPSAARVKFTVPVRVTMTIFYRTYRPDLDESLILDILQRAWVYKNDRLVREKHIHHGIDAANPRAEIHVEPLAA